MPRMTEALGTRAVGRAHCVLHSHSEMWATLPSDVCAQCWHLELAPGTQRPIRGGGGLDSLQL